LCSASIAAIFLFLAFFLPATVAFERQRSIAGNDAADLRRHSGDSAEMAGAIFTALQRRTSRRKQEMIEPFQKYRK
jgi:hypothetical protein